MKTIFSAGWQGVKVRFVQVLVLLMSPVCLWAAWGTAFGYGLHPQEGGELAPLGLRVALCAFFLVLGVGFAVGMWVYGRCYVMRAEVDEERGVLRITRAGLLVPRRLEVPLEAVAGSRDHHGQFYAGGVRVNAPWSSVRLRDRRLPLIVDAQGDVLDQALVNLYLLDA